MAKLKPLPKAILVATVIGAIGFGAYTAMNAGYFKPKATMAGSVPEKIDLPAPPTTSAAPSTSVQPSVPSVATIAPTQANSGDTIRIKTIPWNGTAGLQFANGDATTAPGSLMAKRGLKVNIKREDDYAKMIADLASFAKNPNDGVHFVIIMGDGFPAFAKGANDALQPFNQSIAVVGALGYSRGEDKCIIDKNANVKGSLIAGYLGDGDINICIKYAGDNGIVVNADPKTYDPDGMNFAGVGSFTEADEKFMAGACENRMNVKTNKSERVCVNGSATWTPGDVKLARERGNLKVLASTKEYAWQMPTTIIGNKQWMSKNPEVVKALLAAAFEGGEQVRQSQQALLKSGEVQAKVYGEQDAAYWAKYHRGVTEATKTGEMISLGGSTTNGLADNAFLFGLDGADNLYKKVYTVYGNIAVKYFPDMLDKLIPYEDVVDTSYVKALYDASAQTQVKDAAQPTFGGQREATVANKAYNIEFDTGKSTVKAGSMGTLNEILDSIAVSSLSVQVNGHTDNVGNPQSNLTLSRARAEAVKQFLMANAPSNFPAERIVTRGFGDTQPVGDNATAAGKAQNRRVEIVLFSTK